MKPSAVLLYNCETVPEEVFRERYAEAAVLTPHMIKQSVKSGQLLPMVGKYGTVHLHTPSLAGSVPPLLPGAAALLVGRRVRLADNEADHGPFTLREWLGIALRHLLEKRTLGRKLAGIANRLAELEEAVATKPGFTDFDIRKGTPVYLRSDLIFGLRAGGSVGHIAGVVNNLEAFSARPHMFTVDSIPTVHDDIPCTVVLPDDKRYWTHKEMSALCFSDRFSAVVWETLLSRTPSFVYQRYCLNNTSGVETALGFGVPFVLEYNGSEVWISRHWGSPLVREKLSQRIERLNLEAADVVVVVSKVLRDELIERGISGSKILVNPNGVDTDTYHPGVSGEAVRKRFGLEGKTVVGFIGTFGRWHGAEVLAEAFGRLLDGRPELAGKLHLLLIGDGMMRSEAQAALDRHGMADHTTFAGVVPQAEGPGYLAACDMLASPHVPNPDGTPFFGSPTKLFEYMAMGRGIVASELDQIGDVLDHEETALLVPPGDPDALAEGIYAMHRDPALRERLGKAARECALNQYSWRQHTRKIVEKLEKVCGGR